MFFKIISEAFLRFSSWSFGFSIFVNYSLGFGNFSPKSQFSLGNKLNLKKKSSKKKISQKTRKQLKKKKRMQKVPIPNQMLLQLSIPLGRVTKVLGNIKVPPPLNFTLIEDLQYGFTSVTLVKLLHSLKIFKNVLILPPPTNFYIH